VSTIAPNPVMDGLLLQVLATDEGRADPYGYYAQMRETAQVSRTALGPLLVHRYDDCMAILRDPRLGRGIGAQSGPLTAYLGGEEAMAGKFLEMSSHNMLLADPPDHTRLRRLVSRSFTPRHMEALRPAITRMVDDLLDEMANAMVRSGQVEFMSEFALPLPMAVIGELVGVPEEDRLELQPHVRAAATAIEPILSQEQALAALAAYDFLGRYFDDLLEERRRSPREDLLSGLAQAREKDDRLSNEEVCSTAILLFAAGFETTTNLLGNGLLALLRHPDQLGRWRREPDLAPSAVEELLRWDSPVQMNLRAALEPADLHGTPIAAGEEIIVLQGAGNHDPTHFSQPQSLDLGRSDNVPLSFGWGIHHCLGAYLARMEGQIAFTALLQRFGTIELLTDEPEWRPSFTLRGLLSLPLGLSAD
jgi:cytochrome P450